MSPKRKGRKGNQAKSRSLPPAILVYGENPNDTHSLRELISALRPELAASIQVRRQPQVLIKNARPEDVPERAQLVANAVDAERAVSEVVAVFAHEDCDDFEPRHEAVCRKIEEALEKAGCPAHAVVPAWELEAWWFLWPEAVKAVRPRSWRAPDDYVGADVGKVKDAKEELQKKVIPKKLAPEKLKSFPHYQESDSPAIARNVRASGLARKPQGRSASYTRFISRVDACSSSQEG